MNLKTVSIAILSALYGATVAAAAQSGSPVLLKQLNPLPANPQQQVQQQQKAATQGINAGARQGVFPGGRNMQIAPASAKEKFKPEANHTGEDVYIVRLRDLPVATYDGRVSGLEATAPAVIRNELTAQSGMKRGADQVSVAEVRGVQESRISVYENFLNNKQESVIAQAQRLGVATDTSSRFTHAINGFTMRMTQQQAAMLAKSSEVAYIQRAEMLQIQTDRGPEFIGAKKVWVGQTPDNGEFKGEGMVVGIIDTGINSDHVAFQDLGENGGDGYDHTNPLGKGNYLGECATGVKECNDKLIGIYSWPVITDSYEGKAPATGEDYNGHGSHTAGTAAGNLIENVPMQSGGNVDNTNTSDGRDYGVTFASASGVAPNANIVSYQVCLANGGCPQEALLLAYEQAIKDGVDVINFSIGGGEQFPWDDPVEQAILSAREAGISVAVAAGNNGGDGKKVNFSSIGHSSPWSMVVAASTHDRTLDKVNNGVSFTGGKRAPYVSYYPDKPADDAIAGYSTGSVTGRPVLAANFGDELCKTKFAPGTFQPDEIVICKRGENGRIEKSENVKAGGAGGFILYNDKFNPAVPTDNHINDDFFELPGLHVTNSAGIQILNWLKDGNTDHQITIQGGSITIGVDKVKADMLAEFSSLGPSRFALENGYSMPMVPQVAAPGVDILAPYADEHPLDPAGATTSRDWAIISGTSMASPHVAGAMALVRQAHKDWTPAEVQSALEMTASNTVRRGAPLTGDDIGFPATQHRAGSGRIDVHAAINSGLVMDETVANFIAANPTKGGDLRQLNLPQLVDSSCNRGVCSWTRTVKATRDGSWTMSGGEWAYDRWNIPSYGEIDMNNAKLEFFPAQFSLKAGESQTIVIKANIQDIQWKDALLLRSAQGLETLELWSQVHLTPDNSNIPAVHWPVSVNFDRNNLPDWLSAKMHRNTGAYHIAGLPLPASDSLEFSTVGHAIADTFELTLPQDNNHFPVYMDNDYTPGHIDTRIINVPADSARLVVEVLKHVEGLGASKYGNINGALQIFIGKDSNNDGKADFNDEWLCGSMTEIELNYCSLTNPEPGNYWVMLSNTRTQAPDNVTIPDLKDTYKVATAVVPMAAGNITVSGPATSDGVNPSSLDVQWDIDELELGDVVYSAIKLGTTGTPDGIGTIPLKLTREMDDISISAPTKVKGGEVIDVALHVVENNSGMDRDFDLSAKLPKGLTLVPGSVTINNAQQKANLTVEGDTIRIAGVQQDSSNWMHTYNVTDSDTDPLCRVPNYGRNGEGFVGLAKNYGYVPGLGGKADDWAGMIVNNKWVDPFQINLADYWGADASLSFFNNGAYNTYDKFRVSPQGFVFFGDAWFDYQHLMHSKFPYYMNPYGPFIAPFWRGQADENFIGTSIPVEALSTPLQQNSSKPWEGSGITLGFSDDEIIVEWVNARTERFTFNQFGAKPTKPETIRDDRYTFDLIMNRNYRYGEGQFEIMMAYDTMDFGTQADFGSIGMHGHYGPLDIFNIPYTQETGIQYAFGGLKDKVKQNKVVCYDYTGPEATQFDVSFKARVAETAAGQTLNMDWISDVTGLEQVTLAHPVEVVGTITLVELSDLTMDENGTATFNVMFSDTESDAKVITVTGENFTSTISSHENDATVTLTPNKDWHGSTMVTVTVADKTVPSDLASQSFELTVTSDGVDPVVETPPPAPKPEAKESSGGAMGGLLALLLPLMWVRRRKM
ncbi:S8 family serine peptidase [Shewanella sp.]|uniref:S8 family serine peptidase n=1 Tax=Shewanella sp. TaxID=50422 RepID=UPI002627ECFA|nr:S8 family serine peptidase [Shewanella sp.]